MARGTFDLLRNIMFYTLRKHNGRISSVTIVCKNDLPLLLTLCNKFVACNILVLLVSNF